jgi:hypothetical protein
MSEHSSAKTTNSDILKKKTTPEISDGLKYQIEGIPLREFGFRYVGLENVAREKIQIIAT